MLAVRITTRAIPYLYLMRLMYARICLEELGVVHEGDHGALVIKVFWR